MEEPYLNIYAGKGSQKRLVTSLEVLSLFNKRPGNKGRNAYLAKQEEMREAEVNLVEIDLLRGGKHATAVPETLIRDRCSPFDYHVCIVKADQPFDYFVYPFKLEEALPRIAIPLMSGIEMPVIDLQATFVRCYDAAKYESEIDYETDAIIPPLNPEQLAWARQRIASSAA
jgi:hypothetical protein